MQQTHRCFKVRPVGGGGGGIGTVKASVDMNEASLRAEMLMLVLLVGVPFVSVAQSAQGSA